MSYNRVLPRDLFNEAKLLKCIGKISLLIHDNVIQGLRMEHNGGAFEVRQGISGELMLNNVLFYDSEGTEVFFSTPLNSKDNWPIEMEYKGEFYYPLNESGEYQLWEGLFKKGQS